MEAKVEGPTELRNVTLDDEDYVFISPNAARDIAIPNISVPEMLFQAIDMNYDIIKNKPWVVDTDTGVSYKFREIKPVAMKIASALTRLGFKKGDVLFFVTQDAALIYLVNIGVWLCGGAVRGSCHGERREAYLNQMREVSTSFALCDSETSASVKWAAEKLDWNVKIISIGGGVEGALSVEEMIEKEDGSAFPKNVKIDPKEDTLIITNTSGSTGTPKGVMHTHEALVTNFALRGHPKKMKEEDGQERNSSLMVAVGNFFTSLFSVSNASLVNGYTFYASSKYEVKSFMRNLLHYKPDTVFLHPYSVHEFVQLPELDIHDFTFLKVVSSGGSVFNYATAKALETKLPHVKLNLVYGTSEALLISSTEYDFLAAAEYEYSKTDSTAAGVKYNILQGDTHMTCGYLDPLVKAKLKDINSGRPLGRNMKGNLWVKTPYLMKGYVSSGEKKDIGDFKDADGWYDTGDIAYFDDEDFLYVVDRNKFTFKTYMHWVSPTEVEAVILKHPDVVSTVVVGVPDPVAGAVAKAFVVIKRGSKVTEDEIKAHVAENTEDYKHLHGGVSFVECLPVTSGGKLNRNTLLKQAIAEMRPST
ncbi:4-coumarate--CoA ligase 3-like [Ischnura elegans]|uniref:4-coumarate--CoA ligase 3-like n=1 Tax=Ischnura elegans TaxID=197161 RepID=UPI001ED898D2|nr:4-coumarate--CoA ligase 3-like [Ischnura elegans]